MELGKELTIDLEANWSYVTKRSSQGDKVVSDKANPFNDDNRVVSIGVFSKDVGYRCFDLERGEGGTLEELKEILDAHDTLIGHNIKYDLHWLRRIGLVDPYKFNIVDTLINEYVLRGGFDVFMNLSLDKVSKAYGFDGKVDLIKPLWQAGANTSEIDATLLAKYLRTDVFLTHAVWQKQKMRLNDNKEWAMPMFRFNCELNKVTQEMEYNGLCINTDIAKQVRSRLEEEYRRANFELYDVLEKAVHPKKLIAEPTDAEKREYKDNDKYFLFTTGQLAPLLFSRKLKKGKDGNGESYRARWKKFVDEFRPKGYGAQKKLEDMVAECFDKIDYGFNVKPHPMLIGGNGFKAGKGAVEILHERGGLSKKAQRFIDAYLALNARKTWINGNYWSISNSVGSDGFVHGSFHQAGTRTGRYSSSDPNLQNLPSAEKNDGLNDVRRMVVSRFGEQGYVYSPDFSQLELRGAMEAAGAKNGFKHYQEGIDIHTNTAKTGWDAIHGEGAYDKLDAKDAKEVRGGAKTVNFGLLYGRMPTDDMGKKLLEAFFTNYPEIEKFQERCDAEILAKGYMTCPLTGWRYHFPKSTERNYYRGYDSAGKGWRNKARNYPIQGSCGRIAQAAMIGIYRTIKSNPEYDQFIKLVGQVHDEITHDVHEKYLDKAVEIAQDAMENVSKTFEEFFGRKIEVPITIDSEAGRDWFNIKDVKEL